MDSRAVPSSSPKEKHLRSPETESTSPLHPTIQAGENAPTGHRSEPSKHTSFANNTKDHKIENTDQTPEVHEAALKEARAEEAAEQIAHRNHMKAAIGTDDTAEDEVEETIITPGARLAEELDLAKALKDTKNNMHQNRQEATVTDEIEEDEAEETVASAVTRSPLDIGEPLGASASTANLTDADGDESSNPMPQRPKGFALPDELPTWFPEHIRAIYTVDRNGGALSYKELNAITKYRGLIEIAHRRLWKRYLKAGKSRHKLWRILHGGGMRPQLTKGLYKYFEQRYKKSKGKAMKAWKKLERVREGTQILDAVINVNVRQERLIYAKKLRGSRKGRDVKK